MRIFDELTPEVDTTAQMYASGLEKKEIAKKKFRAISTITNQLQVAFRVLKVRNGRELAMKMAEKMTGVRIEFDWQTRSRVLAWIFLGLILINLRFESGRQRVRQRVKIEYVRKLKE